MQKVCILCTPPTRLHLRKCWLCCDGGGEWAGHWGFQPSMTFKWWVFQARCRITHHLNVTVCCMLHSKTHLLDTYFRGVAVEWAECFRYIHIYKKCTDHCNSSDVTREGFCCCNSIVKVGLGLGLGLGLGFHSHQKYHTSAKISLLCSRWYQFEVLPHAKGVMFKPRRVKVVVKRASITK